MPTFPSIQWFEAVRNEFNRDGAFRGAGGGRCDCTVGIKVGREVVLLTFEGFECSASTEGSEAALEDVDFYLKMKPKEWRDMLENIRDNGHAINRFTLNTLDLDLVDGLSASKHGDQYREDLFFRYNQSLQFFFDASSRIKTVFS